MAQRFRIKMTYIYTSRVLLHTLSTPCTIIFFIHQPIIHGNQPAASDGGGRELHRVCVKWRNDCRDKLSGPPEGSHFGKRVLRVVFRCLWFYVRRAHQRGRFFMTLTCAPWSHLSSRDHVHVAIGGLKGKETKVDYLLPFNWF